jgi:amidase
MSITTTVLWRMSALELAEAIRSRKISSQEVIEAHLQRIEEVNPSVNALTVVLGEQALEAAKAADRAVAAGGDLPPFHGVPFTVKGNIDLAGTPTTQGRKRARGRLSESGRPRRRASQGCGGDPHRPYQPLHLRGSLAL